MAYRRQRQTCALSAIDGVARVPNKAPEYNFDLVCSLLLFRSVLLLQLLIALLLVILLAIAVVMAWRLHYTPGERRPTGIRANFAGWELLAEIHDVRRKTFRRVTQNKINKCACERWQAGARKTFHLLRLCGPRNLLTMGWYISRNGSMEIKTFHSAFFCVLFLLVRCSRRERVRLLPLFDMAGECIGNERENIRH